MSHTVIDFRTPEEREPREDALEFSVDQDMAALIRTQTRAWRKRNGLEHEHFGRRKPDE